MARVSARSETKWTNLPRFHLGISMGSGHHHGETLTAIVDWLNTHNFECGMIDVSDTLNRYNYMIAGTPEKEAFEITRREGVKWELQNKQVLSNLKMPIKLIHWDQWLQDPRFNPYHSAFHAAFDRNPAFRMAIMQDIQRHYSRKYNQSIHERSAADIELSKEFYIEELAVLSIQFEDYPCVEVYPGRELDCVKIVRGGQVKGVPDGLKNAVYASLFIHSIGEKAGAA